MALRVGDRVRHPKLHDEWGPGEVLAVSADGKTTIHFALGGQKVLKGVVLEVLTGDEAAHPMLANRKTTAPRKRSMRSVASMKEAFLKLFPGGFEDPKYLAEERNYKVAAGELLAKTLGETELKALLDSDDFTEISKRAIALVSKTNLVFPNEKMDFKDALSNGDARRSFGAALYDVLYGEGDYRPRFEAFIALLDEIGAAKWPIATYFPFIANPKEQMFLKPDVTKRAAEACNFELNYRPELNWYTYEALLKFTASLEEQIAELKPRDRIDMQSFVFCIGERVT